MVNAFGLVKTLLISFSSIKAHIIYLAVVGIPVDVVNGELANAMKMYVAPDEFILPADVLILNPFDKWSI